MTLPMEKDMLIIVTANARLVAPATLATIHYNVLAYEDELELVLRGFRDEKTYTILYRQRSNNRIDKVDAGKKTRLVGLRNE